MLFKTENELWIWIIWILSLIILISILVISFTVGTSITSLNRFVHCTLYINRLIAHTSRTLYIIYLLFVESSKGWNGVGGLSASERKWEERGKGGTKSLTLTLQPTLGLILTQTLTVGVCMFNCTLATIIKQYSICMHSSYTRVCILL